MTTGRSLLLALLVAALFAGCTPGSRDPVEAYCSYGAVSEAQLDGCLDHVTEDDFANLDTHAAEYARGELDECLEDSGPFCDD